jgi:peptide-methionine (S)-S-oxide reductase
MSAALTAPPRAAYRDRLIGVATFAAGAVAEVDRVLREQPGVLDTTVGYAGGSGKWPSFARVAPDATARMEAVRVEFDPARISYEELLDLFWRLHDPTQPRRGSCSRHRSAIFVHSREQERAAIRSLEAVAATFPRPVLTEIVRAPLFYPAL